MADTNFVDGSTVIQASWLNDINRLNYTVFQNAVNAADARAAIDVYSTGEANAAFVNVSGDIMTGPLTLNDDLLLSLGTGNDLQLSYVSATNRSLIASQAGELRIEQQTAQTPLYLGAANSVGSVQNLVAVGGVNPQVSLYLSSVEALRTISTGISVGPGAASQLRQVLVGDGRTASGPSQLYLIGDTTYTTYGARFERGGGVNAVTILGHRGTGTLLIGTEDAGLITFQANNVSAFNIDSAGGFYASGQAGQGLGTINGLEMYEAGLRLATLASPAFTGTPTAPTQTTGDNSTKLATTAYVDANTPQRIENPLFEASLMNSLVPTKGVGAFTFTRASTATYIDRYGVLKTAAINAPRFERWGILIEGASTNSLLQSDDATVATWTKTNCAVTTDTTLNPDGVTNSQKVTLSTAALGYIRQTLTIPADTSYWSIQIKVKEGNADECSVNGTIGTTPFEVSYSFLDEIINASSGVFASFELLPGGWVLLNVSAQNNNNTTLTYDFNPDISNTSGGFSYFCNGQAENLPICTSYIPTTTIAVSRSADVLSIPLADNHPSLKYPDVNYPEGFSLVGDIRFLAGNLAADRVVLDAGSEAAKARYSLIQLEPSSGTLNYYRGAVPLAITTILNPDIEYRFGVSVNASEDFVTTYFDGVQINFSTDIIDTESVTHQTNMGVGCNALGTEQMFGHISNLKIYNKQLNAGQMRVA